ncbi:GrpB family protein [Oscillatoria sp. FACHB-1407]|uniref:GrpB family protein n=1 Tax=Oscillatoria sp. FACHB-1407 TaxID=2692847 RepID=UPI001687BD90|nr:GrpB family protein [Oscillatoria sp. FACHB-1407]MBD2465859.1 GrpB family protein [Oscillatoria sp. FACHB-1407]
MSVRVEVVPYCQAWPDAFEIEAQRIVTALDENVVAVYHIGSTAIPNIYAKPIIDLLVVVHDITQVDEQIEAMEALGYEALVEFGIPGRRYFRKNNELGVRTHHVHTFESNSSEIERHLAFRDYMIAHPEDAHQYSELKRELVKNLHWSDIEGYMDGKNEFIKEMEQRAIAWRRSRLLKNPT